MYYIGATGNPVMDSGTVPRAVPYHLLTFRNGTTYYISSPENVTIHKNSYQYMYQPSVWIPVAVSKEQIDKGTGNKCTFLNFNTGIFSLFCLVIL
jgi:hypothetical protein